MRFLEDSVSAEEWRKEGRGGEGEGGEEGRGFVVGELEESVKEEYWRGWEWEEVEEEVEREEAREVGEAERGGEVGEGGGEIFWEVGELEEEEEVEQEEEEQKEQELVQVHAQEGDSVIVQLQEQ